MQTQPANHAQLNLLQHLQRRLNHVSSFYFAGALLDIADKLIRQNVSKLTDDTNAYQLYHLIQPFEILYFRAAVGKTYTSQFTTQTKVEE